MDLSGKSLILGSNSPRRRELLAALDIPFSVDARTFFEERFDPSTPHPQVPALMAEGKSLGFHRPLERDELLLTADTMVLCDSLIMGKPSGPDEAARMLRALSGRSHEVITAVTLRSGQGGLKTQSDVARGMFEPRSEGEISYYIEKYRPFDKAGAYGIQEWIGYMGISRIEGSFYTVMGLPVHLVYRMLREMA